MAPHTTVFEPNCFVWNAVWYSIQPHTWKKIIAVSVFRPFCPFFFIFLAYCFANKNTIHGTKTSVIFFLRLRHFALSWLNHNFIKQFVPYTKRARKVKSYLIVKFKLRHVFRRRRHCYPYFVIFVVGHWK